MRFILFFFDFELKKENNRERRRVVLIVYRDGYHYNLYLTYHYYSQSIIHTHTRQTHSSANTIIILCAQYDDDGVSIGSIVPA